MTSRERVQTTLNHREPDRVPYDLSGTTVTSICKGAFLEAMQERGLSTAYDEAEADPIQQIVTPGEEALVALRSDTRRIGARRIPQYEIVRRKEGNVWVVVDSWGCEWRMEEGRHLYFSQCSSPLEPYESITEGLLHWSVPEWDEKHVQNMEQEIVPLANALGEYCGVADRNCAGFTEVSMRVRGHVHWYMDTLQDPQGTEALIDQILMYKIEYWKSLFRWIKNHGLEQKIQVISECDDLGAEHSTLLDPAVLRRLVIPRFGILWKSLRQQMPGAKMFMHSCGSIRPVLPDLIEAGLDILNPVQFTASGMDLKELKRDFGNDITFWGGGVDTQSTLVRGSPEEIRDEVKRILDIMAPGGGYVFAPVHNVQNDVSARNFWAMWDTLMEYGAYH